METNNSNFEYVDLGLPSGTLWADRNVGADSPEDYGSYHTWYEAMKLDVSLPTYKQIKELLDFCKRERQKNGYKIVGKNGNSIFLPAAGYRYGTSLYGAGSRGFYWSSSANESHSYYAYSLGFLSGYYYCYSGLYRDHGHSVRPVCHKEKNKQQ